MSPAAPDEAKTNSGTDRFLSMSRSFGSDHAASSNSGEKIPVTAHPVFIQMMKTSTMANRKAGMDNPMNPRNVNR